MFREMRRKNQELTGDEAELILQNGSSGVLALSGDEGYPYAVPLSYAYSDGSLYFHSAVAGHKIDAIKNAGKASFCVIGQDEVIPSEFTTRYKSVVVFGKISILEDGHELRAAMEKLAAKYSPGYKNEGSLYIERHKAHYVVIKLAAEHISGKQANPIY